MGARQSIDRSTILETAYRIAEERGLASVSIRTVASACGVSVGSIYNYYPSKDELVIDVVSMFWQNAFHSDIFIHMEDNESFVDFAERVADSMGQALSSFREDWLPEIHALDTQARAAGKERESQSFAHMRAGFMRALEADKAVDHARVAAATNPGDLCGLVLRCIMNDLATKQHDRIALFALLRMALY